MPQPPRESSKAPPHGNAGSGSKASARKPPQQPPPQRTKPADPRPPHRRPRPTREERRANRQQQRATRIPRQQRRRAAAPPGSPGKPLRGWRSWWATHELDRRYRRRRSRPAARSQIGGGFPAMRRWGTLVSAGVLTLLLLTLFSGAIALGAESLPAAIVAFCFFAGALAVGTAAQARAVYSADPANTAPPLEDVADLHIDDIHFSDEPDANEVSSVADLQRSFSDAPPPAEQAAARALGPAKTEAGEQAADDAADEADSQAPQEDPAGKQDEDDEDDPDAAALPEGFEAPLVPEEPARQREPDSSATAEDADDPEATSVAAQPKQQEASADTAAPADDAAGSDTSPADEDGDEAAASTDVHPVTASSGATLSLLTAETPGTDLLTAYTASQTQLPPAAVRDVAATLIVSDLDRSIMFYTELLGLVEIDSAPDAVLLEAGFGRVLLWQRDDAPGAGDPVMHLTFEVGDIDTAYESLRAKGVRFTHPPVSALSGEVHKLRAASFLDPDGHGLALTELREH